MFRATFLARTLLLAIALFGATTAISSPSVHAKGFVVGKFAFKKLGQAHKYLAEKEYKNALEVTNRIITKRGLSDHEYALAWQTLGYVYGEMEDYKKSSESFEKALAYDALPEQTSYDIEYNLGQIYMATSNFEKAIKTLKNWLKRSGKLSADAHYLIANAHMQLKRPKSALPHAKLAVQLHKKVPESWLQMLASLYFETHDYRAMSTVLKRLIKRNPGKRDYWLQLSSIYCELNDEPRCLAVLQLADARGLLKNSREYTTLAQLYLANHLPLDAAEALTRGRKLKVVEDSLENTTMLARCLMNAREMDDAVPPLRKAAKQSKKGELYVELGQLFITQERWKDAQEALTAALDKGQLNNTGNVYLLLGVAHNSAGKTKAAREAFREALKFEGTKRPAQSWLNLLRIRN